MHTLLIWFGLSGSMETDTSKMNIPG